MAERPKFEQRSVLESDEASSRHQNDPPGSLSRRDFLEIAGSATVALSLPPLSGCKEAAPPSTRTATVAAPTPRPTHEDPLRAFEEHYRRAWAWDGKVCGTHNLNCAWQVACNFNIYSRDGEVVREEQAGIYPQTNPHVPDFNPRGCQKGASYSELMYSVPRLRHPLQRTGARGEGKWRQVSWDEALTGIADKLIDAMSEDGPDTVVLDTGTNPIGQTVLGSMIRFADVIDCVILDVNSEIGDEQQGAAVTLGNWAGGRSGDDFFNSDLIVIWGGNPVYTQIPDSHFLLEARYNGATLVTIAPDFSPSAIHADLWIPIEPGTDAALALAMARVVIDEKLYDEDLVREQTDLPFLVRLDNKKLLRESDLKRGGSVETLYRYDLARGRLEAPGVNSLALNGSVPALEGIFEVETLTGKVQVQPAFELVKARLADYTPESASKQCGVAPQMIRKLAKMLAGAKAAGNIATTLTGKYYHGDLMQRAQILAFVLCGHLGAKGAGFVAGGGLFPDGQSALTKDHQAFKEMRWSLMKKHGVAIGKEYLLRRNTHRAVIRTLGDLTADGRLMSNATLLWNVHGGLLDVSGQRWDPEPKREIADYVREALEKEWQVVEPIPGKRPRVLISWAGNALRRVRGSQRLREVLWPKLDLVVVFEVRMSTTAMHADYVLPVAAAYEKPSVAVNNVNVGNPFLHASNKAVEPPGEGKDEWEIACLLTKKIQQRASERGLESFTSRRATVRRFDRMYDTLTRKGKLGEKNVEELTRILVNSSTNAGDAKWDEVKKTGIHRLSGVGNEPFNFGQASDVEPGQTITPYTWHTEKKEPWPTLSGRIQFYIDHDWYQEFGEELPVYKPPPMAGGDYPLVLGGGHARWSIHAMQRSDPLLLRLQRGEPCMWISTEDAARRGIADGNRIEVFNDVGKFITRAKVAAALRPGQVIMYHAWEDYQFEGGIGYRNVMPSPLKPLEMVGDYPFLKPMFAVRQPGQCGRDTRVDVRKT